MSNAAPNMPVLSRTADLRLLYLDTSFFVELERGFSVQSPLARKLGELTETVPLCLSFITIAELARGKRSDDLNAMARFLDSLRPRWLRPENEIAAQEARSYLLSPVNGPFGACDPVDSSIYGAFRRKLMRDENLDLVTDNANIETFFRQIQNSAEGRELVSGLSSACGPFILRLQDDRRSNHPFRGNSRAGREHTDRKLLVSIKAHIAQQAQEAATKGDLTVRLQKVGSLYLPAATAGTEPEISDIPKFPAQFLGHEFTHFRSDVYEGMNENNLKAMASGEVGDYFHTVGAAYCEFFSCDKRVGAAIAGGRARLGLRPPFVTVQRGALGLLEDIEKCL